MGDINWSLYDTRLSLEGSTHRERNLNRLKQSVLNNAPDSISYKEVLINNINQALIVIDTEQPTVKKIKSMPDETFKSGNYIDYANSKWLIIKSDFDDEVYTDGEMVQCPLLLKWQNSTGQIITRHAVVEKPITTSLDEGTIITTSQKKYNIKLPFDADTQNLFIDKRFLTSIIGGKPQAYKVIDIDGISGIHDGVGVMNITLEADRYNSDVDNAELMIANYITTLSEPNGQAQISGSSTMYSGGSYRYYVGSFEDQDGNILPDIIPVWSVIILPEHIDKFIYNTEADGRFRIKTKELDMSIIGTSIKIVLSDIDELYKSEKLVEVGVL